ncbi:MAG: DUF1826 domain-containing protein, partial [Pseudomonadota bacterium]
MTLVSETIENAAVGVGIAETPQGLSAIHHPGCAAAIWRRQPLDDFQTWINDLPVEQLPRARMILPVSNVHQAVTHICNSCGTPDCEERGLLIDDTAALASLFVNLIPASHIQLRLDVVTTSICPKFHIDAVTARLICTYRGTGTQYGISTDGADPRRVFTTPTGSPILLQGTQWPDGPKSGLLHRSPSIEDTGEARLLLVIDPVDEQIQDRPNPE